MTTALTREQLAAYIRELDAEYHRNRTAAETLLQAIEKSAPTPAPRSFSVVPSTPTLGSKIADVMEAKPEKKWTPKEVYQELTRQGHNFGKAEPMKRIGNEIPKLVKRGKVVLVARGVGSTPHQYQWYTHARIEPASGSLEIFTGKPQ